MVDGRRPASPVMARRGDRPRPRPPSASATAAGPRPRPRSRSPQFDGPLALLLALIEARQLDVLTVPLGGLADAYLDALARLEDDRLGNVSAFVAVASQLILIKSRAMLPRRPAVDPTALADEGPDPEAELRARLILYRALPRRRPAPGRRRARADRPVPPRARRRPRRRPGRRPTRRRAAARPGAGSSRRWRASPRSRRRRPPPPEVMPRTITLTERAAIIRAALRDAPSVVLQDLLAGVRDRVVDRGHVPGDARAHEAARDRRRAGRAVGPDRRPGHDGRGARRGRPGADADADGCAARRDPWSRSRDRRDDDLDAATASSPRRRPTEPAPTRTARRSS